MPQISDNDYVVELIREDLRQVKRELREDLDKHEQRDSDRFAAQDRRMDKQDEALGKIDRNVQRGIGSLNTWKWIGILLATFISGDFFVSLWDHFHK